MADRVNHEIIRNAAEPGTRVAFRVMAVILRITLGLVLLYAGIARVRQPHDFLRAVYDYQIVGPPLGRWVAMILPHLEIVVGVALIGNVATTGALILVLLLTTCFLAAQLAVVARRMDVACGCFGDSTQRVGAQTILKLIAVVSATVVAIWAKSRGVSHIT